MEISEWSQPFKTLKPTERVLPGGSWYSINSDPTNVYSSLRKEFPCFDKLSINSEIPSLFVNLGVTARKSNMASWTFSATEQYTRRLQTLYYAKILWSLFMFTSTIFLLLRRCSKWRGKRKCSRKLEIGC